MKRNDARPVSAAGTTPAPPCILVIFGAAGDLTARLLIPSLYNLAGAGLLDHRLQILGVDRQPQSTAGWRKNLGADIRSFALSKGSEFHAAKIDAKAWAWVSGRLDYCQADFEDPASFRHLAEILSKKKAGNVIFYLAVAARFFGPIVDRLAAAGLLGEAKGTFRRVVIEKPFGADLASARALNRRILRVLEERQIYRMDHFLGKETVENILAFRFGNRIYEPIWGRRYIDHVQITAAETLGVEHRGAFYEPTGALRDMVANHLFQLLSMIAMERPASLGATDVREAKGKLIRAIVRLRPADFVRGQYGKGKIDGQPVPPYRREPGVSRRSRTETYVALKLKIANRRWAGVPFYLRTGKRLGDRRTEVAVFFKPVSRDIFRRADSGASLPNCIRLRCDPAHGIQTVFAAKVPGPEMKLAPVATTFRYKDYFTEKPNVGYETLVYDCMMGDRLLFQGADAIEGSWAAVAPALRAWAKSRAAPPIYASGSEGPAAADRLIRRDGRSWLPLTGPKNPDFVRVPLAATPR